jgi:pimeloyl-ACP methyl ester carboxylesterase
LPGGGRAIGAAKVATLEVPGTSLHYEVRGSGPALLIIPGMPADAGFYAAVAGQLAGTWTVVAYDPRGMSRSRLHGPPEDQRVEVHADDAHRVLAAAGQGPAHVLTDSISGLPGLQLAASHPEQVRTLVAFEPPLTELLPDRERWRAFYEDLHATYRSDGLGPALQRFAEAVGLGGEEPPQGDPDPEVTASMARMGGNVDFWLSHVIRPSFLASIPDIAALRAGPARIVPVIGAASRPHQLSYQTTHALAGQLGTSPVVVPGDHNAVTSRPEEFATALRRMLDCNGSSPDRRRRRRPDHHAHPPSGSS